MRMLPSLTLQTGSLLLLIFCLCWRQKFLRGQFLVATCAIRVWWCCFNVALKHKHAHWRLNWKLQKESPDILQPHWNLRAGMGN